MTPRTPPVRKLSEIRGEDRIVYSHVVAATTGVRTNIAHIGSISGIPT
jgi:hypothetical protein